MHGGQIAVDEATFVELTEDRHDATGTVHVFHVHVRLGWRHLRKHRNAARQPVDVFHGEIEFSFMSCGEDVQHGVGGPAHGDVEGHGVLESAKAGDLARQHAHAVLLVIALGEIDDQVAGFDEQAFAVRMRGERRTVTGQRETKGFGQAVHGIGGEHAGTRTAGRTGGALDDRDILVRNPVIGGGHHGIDQIDCLRNASENDLSRFHRATGYEDRGDVETERGHKHAGGDLVAVRNAHHGIGAMGIHHILDRIGDDLARGQRIEHAVMAHGDAVINRNGVEFLGDTAGLLDLPRHQLAEILQVDVAGNELREGIDDGDDRLAEILVLHASGAPQAAGTGHVAAMGCRTGTICGHGLHQSLVHIGIAPRFRWNQVNAW